MSGAGFLTVVVVLAIVVIKLPQLARLWRRWRRRGLWASPPDSGGGVWDGRDQADPDDLC